MRETSYLNLFSEAA